MDSYFINGDDHPRMPLVPSIHLWQQSNQRETQPVTARLTACVADDLRRSSQVIQPRHRCALALSVSSKRHLGFSTKICGHSTALARRLTEGSCCTDC